PAGRWVETGPRWQFGLETLVGPQGWWTVTPLLAVGCAALGFLAVGVPRRVDDPDRSLIAPGRRVAGVVLLLLSYYVFVVRRTDYAGQSFGVRHLLPVTPLVYAFAVLGIRRFARGRSFWRHGLTAGLLAATFTVGGAYAWVGAEKPWTRLEQRGDSAMVHFLGPGALYPYSSYQR
ncbi:MAG: hypothetical protein ACRDD1_21650, partial [Planctomycetia bacterium]